MPRGAGQKVIEEARVFPEDQQADPGPQSGYMTGPHLVCFGRGVVGLCPDNSGEHSLGEALLWTGRGCWE
jgi:hypothetical protein